jgi:SAM-dependent methyltransferase
MVVEHLSRPSAVFAEFARVLAPGGSLVVHTPNAWSYFVMIARLVPVRFRRRLASLMDRRPIEDVFRTHYRANTPRRIRRLLQAEGFAGVHCRLVASDAVMQEHRWASVLELLLIRATLAPWGRPFRVSMIVTARRAPARA